MGGDYVFSRKPNPTLISTTHFDEAVIRDALRAAHGAGIRAVAVALMHAFQNQIGRAHV